MAAPVQVRVSVTEYRFSHLRDPRGEGRWMFEVDPCHGEGRFTHYGFYAQAKSAAIRWAKTNGVGEIHVCP